MYQGPISSRAPGNVSDEEYYRLLDLAGRDPREAMMVAANLLGSGDGSNHAAIACNMIAAISYARLLENSEEERNAVFALPLWEGLPPAKVAMLFVAFRLRYQAGRTKTPAYERARIHYWAIGEAYQRGIELHHVLGYIVEHGIENLYAWSQRPAITDTQGVAPVTSGCPTGRLVLPDLSGQQVVPKPLFEPVDIPDEEGDHRPVPVPAASPPAGPPPGRKPPKGPRYPDEVPPSRSLSVRVSDEHFDFALGEDGPPEFMLRCRRLPNGGSEWKRIDGEII